MFTIYADKNSLVQLALNVEFANGRHLQQVVRNSRLVLLIQPNELDEMWEDIESDIRKFCDAYGLKKPVAEFIDIYKNPNLCYEKDPFAVWFINTSEENISKFRLYFGVWMFNTTMINDCSLQLEYQSLEYVAHDEVHGASDNGYKNYIDASPEPLPPLNSILINDRWLIDSTNKKNIKRNIQGGLKNLELLLDALLPPNGLKIPFHITVYCQHPEIEVDEMKDFIRESSKVISEMREYKIVIEFIFDRAEHKRMLYTNHFQLRADRGFNAFKTTNNNQLWGENDFNIKGYLDKPQGLVDFQNAYNRISRIYKCGCSIILSSTSDKYIYAITDCDNYNFFHNRLFPNLCN